MNLICSGTVHNLLLLMVVDGIASATYSISFFIGTYPHTTVMQAIPDDILPKTDNQVQSRGTTLVATCVLFIVLDTVFVGLRHYARRYLKSMPFASDDLLVLLAWLTHIGVCVVVIIMVYDAGIGHLGKGDIWTDPIRFVAWSKSIYALQMLYFSAVALPKISICLLYLSIFDRKSTRLATHLILWVLVVNWVVWIVVTLLQCRPIAYQWNKNIPGGRCVSLLAIYKASGAPNIATDVAILVLPMKMALQLHLSWSRKLGVLVVFWTASIPSSKTHFVSIIWSSFSYMDSERADYGNEFSGIVASCIRMACFFQSDRSFVGRIDTYLWTVIEPGMYLAAVCFVRLRPMVALARGKMHITNICSSRLRSSSWV
ncbi:unnamed protein product [Periconia digitata]|uniref:Rhodopsin domain-containing protein n=1 Tax=Periconia digitata TaxID=1303443 RepID=A0A9W4UEH9_9PLEO|nr:unnamed protein product [Periconia digitata]